MMADFHPSTASRGFTLIEVLITIVILAVGLLGLALMQMTSLSNQLESYQRAQAMLSLEDMANRIRVNSVAARAGDYPDGDQYGLLDEEACEDPAILDDPAIDDSAERDLCYWNTALAGSGITLAGTNTNVGGLVGARGCIENIDGSGDGDLIIRLTIAWQGTVATVAPASVCGKDAFGDDDKLRRVASVDVVLADLAL
jgi:type IV pilus assembly protein PilV